MSRKFTPAPSKTDATARFHNDILRAPSRLGFNGKATLARALIRENNVCHYCHTEVGRQIDHIFPVEWQGVVLCVNRSDNGRTYDVVWCQTDHYEAISGNGADMFGTIINAAWTCNTCHARKTSEQARVTVGDKEAMRIFYQRWYSMAKTRGLVRQTVTKRQGARVKINSQEAKRLVALDCEVQKLTAMLGNGKWSRTYATKAAAEKKLDSLKQSRRVLRSKMKHGARSVFAA